MDNNDIYIEKYKTLEYLIKNQYNLSNDSSPILYISNLKEFRKYKKELDYCREVRNFLQHENKIEKEFAIIASNEMINLIDKLINIVSNPVKCLDICTKTDQVFYKSLNDYVFSSLLQLENKNYSYIPIIENGVVIAIFSRVSLFNYMIDKETNELKSSLKFIDIIDYIRINDNYIFVPNDFKVTELEQIFIDKYTNGKKILMAFVTANGKANEVLNGILTAYDVIKGK